MSTPTQDSEYAIVIDEVIDAVLLRELLEEAAQKHHTRASKATQRAALTDNMRKYECFSKYADRCEQIRLDKVRQTRERMGIT